MPEREHPAPFEGGPYLKAAVLCEKVLEEKDGALSAIRLVDRILLSIQSSAGTDVHLTPTVNLVILVSFVAGNARGSSTIKVRPEDPSGLKKPEIAVQVFLEGEERAANVIMPITFALEQEGLYWFDILLDDVLVTRIPLRVVRQILTVGTQQ